MVKSKTIIDKSKKKKIIIDKSKKKKVNKQKQKQSQKVIVNFFKDVVRKKKKKRGKGKPTPAQNPIISSNYVYKDPVPHVPQQMPPPQVPVLQNVGGIPNAPAPIIQPADIQQAVREALRAEGRAEYHLRARPAQRQAEARARPEPVREEARPRNNIERREDARRDNAERVGEGGHQVPQVPINLINPEQQQRFQRQLRREYLQQQREQETDTDSSQASIGRRRHYRVRDRENERVGGNSGIGGQSRVQRNVALGNMEEGGLRNDANRQLQLQQVAEEERQVREGLRGVNWDNLMENLYQRPYGQAEVAGLMRDIGRNTNLDSQNPSNLSQAYAPSEVMRRFQTGVEDRQQIRIGQQLTAKASGTESSSSGLSIDSGSGGDIMKQIDRLDLLKPQSSSSGSETDKTTRHLENIAQEGAIRESYKAGDWVNQKDHNIQLQIDNLRKQPLTEGNMEKMRLLQSILSSDEELSSDISEIDASKIEHMQRQKDPVLRRIEQGLAGFQKPQKDSKAQARNRLRRLGEDVKGTKEAPQKGESIARLQEIAKEMGSSGDEVIDYSRIISSNQGGIRKNTHLDKLRKIHDNLKVGGNLSPDEFPVSRKVGVAKGQKRGNYRQQRIGMGGEVLPNVPEHLNVAHREIPKEVRQAMAQDTMNVPERLPPAPSEMGGQGLPSQQPPQRGVGTPHYNEWVQKQAREKSQDSSSSSSSESEGGLHRRYYAHHNMAAPVQTLEQIAFAD